MRLGARIPVTLYASDAVMVSHLSEQRLVGICNQVQNATPDQIKMFMGNAAQAAKSGVCVSPSMVIAGVQNISLPITDYSGQVIASLSIPYIQRLVVPDDPDMDTAIQAMIEAGHKISNLLGASVVDSSTHAKSLLVDQGLNWILTSQPHHSCQPYADQ